MLLSFGGIVGDAAGQIPPDAIVSSAMLRLNSLDTGNGGDLARYAPALVRHVHMELAGQWRYG